MPITTCQTHGESGCPEMCEHLYENLGKGVFLLFYTLPVYTIRMCMGCFEKYNVQEIISTIAIDKKSVENKKKEEKGVYRIAPDYHFESAILKEENPEILNRIEEIYHELNKKSGFECSNCIDDIQLDYARKNNLELPFEPFENTIIHGEDKRITELDKMLDKYLETEGVSVFERPRTFETSSGWVRRPLTIKIYGVTAKEEQESLLKLIDKFYEKIAQKQRKIIFFEPLHWITEELENGMVRRYRDKTKMLLEVVVK